MSLTQFREEARLILQKYSLAGYIDKYDDAEFTKLFNEHKDEIMAIDCYKTAKRVAEKHNSSPFSIDMKIRNKTDRVALYQLFLKIRKSLII